MKVGAEFSIEIMEATPGIEPGYADLQSAASPLRHVASGSYVPSGMVPGMGLGPELPAEWRLYGAPDASIIEMKLSTSMRITIRQTANGGRYGVSGWLRDLAGGCRQWFDGLGLETLARRAKRDGLALYLAARHPGVPRAVKAFAVLVAAYVLSPIDLIPDFIPVIGFLDELILLPIVVGLLVRAVDPAIMAELRAEAALLAERPRSSLGAMLIVAVWTIVAGLLVWACWPSR
jgi:uncharacterized membrane protein YkvA (DUF1232 family)